MWPLEGKSDNGWSMMGEGGDKARPDPIGHRVEVESCDLIYVLRLPLTAL